MRRADAITRTLATLRFFHASVQSADVDATGYKGFYYHFLDMESGRRVWKCELSTIDSAILIAGMLTAAAYFSGEDEDEREIRALADALYLRADWNWAQNGGVTVTHGWKPERGFLRYRWEGYCEAMILYLLGLGSPTHPLPRESWARMDLHIRLANTLRSRASLCGPALHPPILAYLDRFSRHSGRLYARQGDRLFREQPPRNLCPAAVCDRQSSSI